MKTQNNSQVFIILTFLQLCLIFGAISTVYALGTEGMVPTDAETESVLAIAERAAAEPEMTEAEEVAAETAELEVTEAEEVAAETAELEVTEAEEVAAETAELEMTEAEEVATETAELELTEVEEVAAETNELEVTEAEEVAAEATEPEVLVGKQQLDIHITAASELISTLTASVDEVQKRAKIRGNQGEKALNEYSETFFHDALKTDVQLRDLKEVYIKLSTNMDDHFNAWAAKISTINNKKLRKSAEKRMKNGKATFAKIEQEMAEGDETAVEFSSNLQDVTKYLSFDMTQSGVKEISSVMKSLVKQGKTIQKQLDKVAELLNELPEPSDIKNL